MQTSGNTQLDQVFLLHSLPYKESGVIVKGLSLQHGIVSALMHGVNAQTQKAASLRAALQIGNLLEWQWRAGRSSLAYLNQCELIAASQIVEIKPLLCLSYINELLLHFLPEGQISEALFYAYQALVGAVTQVEDEIEILLREFERLLFSELGWLIDFGWDESQQQEVQAGLQYIINPEQGVLKRQGDHPVRGVQVSGQALKSLAERNYSCLETKRLAKQVHRMIIDYHLAGRPLKSRKLYQQL